jgi:hypothetical protein
MVSGNLESLSETWQGERVETPHCPVMWKMKFQLATLANRI